MKAAKTPTCLFLMLTIFYPAYCTSALAQNYDGVPVWSERDKKSMQEILDLTWRTAVERGFVRNSVLKPEIETLPDSDGRCSKSTAYFSRVVGVIYLCPKILSEGKASQRITMAHEIGHAIHRKAAYKSRANKIKTECEESVFAG